MPEPAGSRREMQYVASKEGDTVTVAVSGACGLREAVQALSAVPADHGPGGVCLRTRLRGHNDTEHQRTGVAHHPAP